VRPGQRGQVSGSALYDQSTADPDVIADDEAPKDVLSAAEAADLQTRADAPAGQNDSNHVKIPVLVVVGQQDSGFSFSVISHWINAH
jgi:hypothetical protein